MENTIKIVLQALVLTCFGALLCMLAWNGFAWEFNLPQFSYWHWMATFAAIRLLQKGKRNGE